MKQLIFGLIISILLTSCFRDIYKSYEIKDNGKIKKISGQVRSKANPGQTRQYTYHLPKQDCTTIDTIKLKSYAETIMKRHFNNDKNIRVTTLSMTNENEGHFKYQMNRYIHMTLDVRFDKTNCQIILDQYIANGKGF